MKKGRLTGRRGVRLSATLLILAGFLLLVLPNGRNGSFSQTAGNAKAGRIIYEKWCAACHGKQGEGLGDMPSFQDPKYMGMRTDRELFKKITEGGQGTGMPPFGSRLPEQERWNIVAYIRTFTPNQ